MVRRLETPDTGRESHAPAPIGREKETALLETAARQAAAGRGSVLLISGEPGLGKTTLVEAFLRNQGQGFKATGHCTEQLGGIEAFLPVLEILGSLISGGPRNFAAETLKEAAPAWYVQLMPHSVSDPGIGPVMEAARTPTVQRLKRELLEFLRRLGAASPVVLFIEDVHWADPSTLDLLAFLGNRCSNLRLLILCTCRPAEFAENQAHFRTTKLDLEARGLLQELCLPFLEAEDVATYLQRQFPASRVQEATGRWIHRHTEGNPLFMVDLVRDLTTRGVLREEGGELQIGAEADEAGANLPRSIGRLIDRNVSRLSPPDREFVDAAAIFGAEFSSALLARVLGLDAEPVEEKLADIETRHGLVRRLRDGVLPNGQASGRYAFTHALYQRALLDVMAPSKRQRLSRTGAGHLVAVFADNTPPIAAQAAALFETGGMQTEAAAFYLEAALHSELISAHNESIALASRALSALSHTLADRANEELELNCRLALGRAYQAWRGFGSPDALTHFDRALALAEKLALPAARLLARRGLLTRLIVRAQYREVGLETGDLMTIGLANGDYPLLAEAYHARSFALAQCGDFTASILLQREGIESYDRHQVRDSDIAAALNPASCLRIEYGLNLWITGFPDQAIQAVDDGMRFSRDIEKVYAIGFCHWFNAVVRGFRREPELALQAADEARRLGHEHELMELVCWAEFERSSALAQLGRASEGIEIMRSLLALMRQYNSEIARPHGLRALVEALVETGDYAGVMEASSECIEIAAANGAACYLSEIHRFRAIAQAATGKLDEAEKELAAALSVSRSQQALSWELRAAITFHSLFGNERPAEAAQLVSGVLSRFTEGFDTGDLRRARAIVESQSGKPWAA